MAPRKISSGKKTLTPSQKAKARKMGAEGPKKSYYTYAAPAAGGAKETYSFSGPPGLKPSSKGITEWKEHRGGRPAAKKSASAKRYEGPKRPTPRKK